MPYFIHWKIVPTPAVFRDAFHTDIPRLKGQIGRMTLLQLPNIDMVQVIKSKQSGT